MGGVFEELRRGIEGVEASGDPAALEELLFLRQRLDARIAESVAEVEVGERWALDGSVSMAAWLRRHGGMTGRDAHRAVRTGRRVRRCPALRDAWRAGELSSGQVEVVTANVTDALLEVFAEQEAAVLGELVGRDVADSARFLQGWAMRAKVALGLEGNPPDGDEGTAHLSPMLDGTGRLDATLDPDGHLTVSTALRLAESPDAEGEQRTAAQRRHDALVDVCQHFLDHQHTKPGGRHRPHLNVVVDAGECHETGPGRTLERAPLAPALIRSIACDANVHRVLLGPRSEVLDYGRATRIISPALYTALVLRDGGCRFPGCDRPADWCDGHHVTHWQDGGPTDLANLALLCRRHHRRVHSTGWHCKLLPDATVEVTRPDGQVMTSDPPGAGPAAPGARSGGPPGTTLNRPQG